MKSFFDRYVGMFCLAMLVLCLCNVAKAQTWNANQVSWSASAKCTDGSPLTQCPVTSYRIERSATPTGSYTSVGTAPADAVSFTHANAAAGQNCYRVIAISTAANSVPSSPPACRSNVQPAPEPPSNVTVKVVEVVAGYLYSPVFPITESGARSTVFAGLTKVGSPCEGPTLFKYQGIEWKKPVRWRAAEWSDQSLKVAAPCG